MECEVVYAPSPDEQIVISLEVEEGTSVREVVRRSGIIFPQESAIGIFGQKIDPDTTIVQEGDRIEIYRPLLIDPKQERVRRGEKFFARTSVPSKQRLVREIKRN
jgi:putative ubiquitin-RnfH superfamily antitoxin RatB of RatAB toxin-antitoxin module